MFGGKAPEQEVIDKIISSVNALSRHYEGEIQEVTEKERLETKARQEALTLLIGEMQQVEQAIPQLTKKNIANLMHVMVASLTSIQQGNYSEMKGELARELYWARPGDKSIPF